MSAGTVVTVVAAVIERAGQVLVCQRKHGDTHPLKWEFPGGKAGPDETARDALRRELEEELAIQAEIGPEIVRYEYSYRGRAPILLVFYRVTRFQGEPSNRVFEEIRWEAPARLPAYDFLEGDIEFVQRLASGEY